MNDILDIDELVTGAGDGTGNGKKDVKQSPAVDVKSPTVSEKESTKTTAQVPNDASSPSTGGRFTPLAPQPGTLDWGCTPTVLFNWFQALEDFWQVNWMVNTAGKSNY